MGSSGADTQSEWEKNDRQGRHVTGKGKRKRKGEDNLDCDARIKKIDSEGLGTKQQNKPNDRLAGES